MKPCVRNEQSGASRRAFSLVEVLLAIFILGIGMIMVASVFPVGANWTRQTAETSIGQNIAQNALTVIQKHYGRDGDLRDFLRPDFYNPPPINAVKPGFKNTILGDGNNVTPFALQALPGFLGIPPTERAYQFGSSNPFPAADVRSCTYFWSALARLSPSHQIVPPATVGPFPTNNIAISSSYNYDIFILVFRKGAVEQVFSQGATEIPGLRDFNNDGQILLDERLLPSVCYGTLNAGSYDPNRTPTVFNALPPMGQVGIGAKSGTVFRQVMNGNFDGAAPRPDISRLPAIEPIIYCPQADGTAESASPLIYVYQTTLSF
jgi:prepilin-type N-terminal cleavage/methylation domain-containing protein